MAAACGTAAVPSTSELARGERAYQKCYSCHALERRAGKLEGPTLHRIVGRRVADVAGFDYSPAMRRFAQRHPRWTPELLDRYIADPERLVPGTSMTFHGIADAAERRALMKYLESSAGRTR